jgi:hypothetical protein
MSPLKNQIFTMFVGTWTLVECIQIDAQGNRSYPWGKDALGYIIYTVDNIMAVQIMRKERSPLGAQDITKDYNAYFGHFDIDETNKTVIHMVEGHLKPELVGKKSIRLYHFYDDKLSLTTQGEATVKKLIWQKLLGSVGILDGV